MSGEVAAGAVRRRLPDERQSVTHKFTIHSDKGDHEGYVTVGLFEDGTPGELFLKMNKEGSTVSGFCDAWAILFSMCLQHQVPARTIVDKLAWNRFEPSGPSENPRVPEASSIVDYVVRWFDARFLTPAPVADP